MISLRLLAVLPLPFVSLAAERPLAEVARESFDHIGADTVVVGEASRDTEDFAAFGEGPDERSTSDRWIFEIGSISKVFTGLLLAIAVNESELTYETRLDELLELEFGDPRVAAITLEQLATHSSGLPRLPANLAPADPADPYADYDRGMLDAWLSSAGLEDDSPFKVSYSNLGFGLLGDLLARHYDQSWEKLVVTKICRPLGLEDTSVELDAGQRARLLKPRAGDREVAPWTFKAMAGAGALRASAADLLRFGQALARPDETPLAAPIRELMRPRRDAAGLGGQIGLGIIVDEFHGEQELRHSGGTGGFRSAFQVIPGREIVRVVLANNSGIAPEPVIVATLPPETPPRTAAPSLDSAHLDRLVGIYELGPGARFTVLRVDDGLRVRLSGQPFFAVEAIDDLRFRYPTIPAELRFGEEDGRVVSLTLLQNGREQTATRSDAPAPAIRFPDAGTLADFAGRYQLAGAGEFVVEIHADTLFAKLAEQPALPVFAIDDNRFRYDVIDAELSFERNDRGEVEALVLHQNGLDQRAPRQ